MDRGCHIKSMIYSEKTELVFVEVGSMTSLKAGVPRHVVRLCPSISTPALVDMFPFLDFLITDNDSLPSKKAFFSASV